MYCTPYSILLHTVLYAILYIKMNKDIKVVGLLFQEHYPACLLYIILLTLLYTVLFTVIYTLLYNMQHTELCTILYTVLYIVKEAGRVVFL